MNNAIKEYETYLKSLSNSSLKEGPLTEEHFSDVLHQVAEEVFAGKGRERHGQSGNFSQQPWRYITDGVGTGFPIGQAIKKLIEIKNYHEAKEPDIVHMASWKREALGAIIYTVMAIMWTENRFLETIKDDNSRSNSKQ